jgi:hypothetical protein
MTILKSKFLSLYSVLKDIEKSTGVSIPIGKDNIFCFDNEAFRFLAAVQHGVNFTEEEVRDFSSSWERSSDNARLCYNSL